MTSAFLNVGLRLAPGAISPLGKTNKGATDLVTLFALDHLRVECWPLACRWHRDDDGRLSCIWEPDIV
jgi:hypothetical protein